MCKNTEPTAIKWDDADSLAAKSEGWGIVEADGSSFNTDGLAPYQLQKLDELDVFESDSDACMFVLRGAAAGNVLHKKALSFLKTESPKDLSWITDLLPEVSRLATL